jgi:formylglycine-generating enzyme required for sulfatase activity
MQKKQIILLVVFSTILLQTLCTVIFPFPSMASNAFFNKFSITQSKSGAEIFAGIYSSCVLMANDTLPPAQKKRKKFRDEDKKDIVIIKKDKKSTLLSMSVSYQANHDFYLTIGRKEPVKVLKDKPKAVSLTVGSHTIAFEEADSTGERIEQFVTVTDDMVRTKDSVYTVSFKNDFIDILNPSEGKTAAEIKPFSEQEEKNKALLDKILSDMILIDGGNFSMGTEGGEADEVPHQVTVNSFQFSKYEITQAQWQSVMGYNSSGNKDCNECPVENVSWNDVDEFINRINKISTKKFRLPTEAEWEYVAKKSYEKEVGIPTSLKEFETKWKNALDKTAAYNNKTKSTQPIGKRKPFFEVYDLMGNVAEWCSDYYRSDYQNDNASNPRGPQTGENKLIKGGSYKESEKTLHISMRESEAPSTQKKTVGFRLASDTN